MWWPFAMPSFVSSTCAPAARVARTIRPPSVRRTAAPYTNYRVWLLTATDLFQKIILRLGRASRRVALLP
eukprot:3422975-Prymnesium_polylepis.1